MKKILGIFLLVCLSFINCGGGMQKFYNKEPAKLVFHIKFELTGYGFVVVVNHTADNGKEETLDLHWAAIGGQSYSWSKNIIALEGDTIFFRTIPKMHICSMQNTLVTLKITINGKIYIETSNPTSIWEEITLKRGITNVQHEN